MSQTIPDTAAKNAAADETAARAVLAHHAQLSAGLNDRVETLRHLVDNDYRLKAETARQDLLDFLRREILPHANAEERALYPPAAALPEGRLLVEGMLQEHWALTALVTELANASSPVRAAAAGRALSALFGTHLAKENDLVLPLLVAAPAVSLADLLSGMHDLLGAADTDAQPGTAAATAAPAGGCGGGAGGGGCGCGGDQPTSSATAPVLTVDTRLDVREVPHGQRHALVLSTMAALPPGDAVVLIASHAPRPVLAEIDGRYGAQVRTQWLQSGPEVWQVRLERVAAPA